jgi:uncharacterized alkaline shock family protein YloU
VREKPVDEKLGKVTIAPNVLVTIVQKTTAAEPGVAQLCDNVPGVKRFLGLHTVDLLQMGRNLQNQIIEAIQNIVGMQVCEVNIHIEDIATELSQDAGKKKEKGP